VIENISAEIIAELRELLARATPRPWRARDGIVRDERGLGVAACYEPGYAEHAGVEAGLRDAALIAAMHAALPALLAAAEQAQGLRLALERDMKAWMKTADDVQRDRNQIAAERDAALSKLAEVKRENERLRKQWDPCDPCYTRTLEREVERLRELIASAGDVIAELQYNINATEAGVCASINGQRWIESVPALATPPADDKKENG
jgi:hypothetical protein